MTMELCLEINSKLQALLEDILIKNITLKVYLSVHIIIFTIMSSFCLTLFKRKALKHSEQKLLVSRKKTDSLNLKNSHKYI